MGERRRPTKVVIVASLPNNTTPACRRRAAGPAEDTQVAARKKTEGAKLPAKKKAVRKAPVRKTKAATNGDSAPTGGGPNLVIVESPAKAKTIKKYLGANFDVAASYGHVRDLPKKPPRGEMGIDIGAGWKPTYVNLDDDRHKQVLADLKKRAARAGVVYLAPDPDREGE